MTDTPRLWDRRADETPKSYAAFLAYVALGARRSVREAARQHCVKTASSGPKNTTVKHWLRWSARHKWVSRSLARDEWIARTSDDQILLHLRSVSEAEALISGAEGRDQLRHISMSLQAPEPLGRFEDAGGDVSDGEQIEDLCDIPDADIERMKAMPRCRAREKRTDKFGGIMAERTVLLDATRAVTAAHLHPDRKRDRRGRIGGRLPAWEIPN